MSADKLTLDLPRPPQRDAYAEVRNGRLQLTSVGKSYRKTVRRLVREQGRMTFAPVRVSMVVHDSGQDRLDLSQVQRVVTDALANASAMLSTTQLDQLTLTRGERKSVAAVVVTLEGPA